jgi:hypothetical protein
MKIHCANRKNEKGFGALAHPMQNSNLAWNYHAWKFSIENSK